jgi:hypothetical protein
MGDELHTADPDNEKWSTFTKKIAIPTSSVASISKRNITTPFGEYESSTHITRIHPKSENDFNEIG